MQGAHWKEVGWTAAPQVMQGFVAAALFVLNMRRE
jgi:hypothetical protein